MTLLPEKYRSELIRAAQTPTDKDPNARAKAIDRVLERVRLMHPELFKDEEHDDHDHCADQ